MNIFSLKQGSIRSAIGIGDAAPDFHTLIPGYTKQRPDNSCGGGSSTGIKNVGTQSAQRQSPLPCLVIVLCTPCGFCRSEPEAHIYSMYNGMPAMYYRRKGVDEHFQFIFDNIRLFNWKNRIIYL
jgi:hypothetical protein